MSIILTVKNFLVKNRRLIIITFELFWIAIFLLEQYSKNALKNIPQFIYVNF